MIDIPYEPTDAGSGRTETYQDKRAHLLRAKASIEQKREELKVTLATFHVRRKSPLRKDYALRDLKLRAELTDVLNAIAILKCERR